MAAILANIITIYLVILAARAVLSWFPVRGGTFLATVNTLLFELTEPVLRPVRRVIPPARRAILWLTPVTLPANQPILPRRAGR